MKSFINGPDIMCQTSHPPIRSAVKGTVVNNCWLLLEFFYNDNLQL